MTEEKTHYGDEDPEAADPDDEEELFRTAQYLGWKSAGMRDKGFAARYEAWLSRQEK
jgi:hypothetical protein